MRAEILAKITENEHLSHVPLANMHIMDDEILEIFDIIHKLQANAAFINLDNNNLSDIGASILSQKLRQFKHLTQLSLQFNDIDTAGAIDIFALKQIFPDLRILFHGNKIINVSEMASIDRKL